MTLDELNDRLTVLIDNISMEAESATLKNATAATTLMKKRVFVDGTNASGVAFTSYSRGYALKRASKGLRTDKKNFNATNTLNTQVKAFIYDKKIFVGVQDPASKTTKSITDGQTETLENVLLENAKREGEKIISLSSEEIKIIQEGVVKDITKYMKITLGL